MTIRVKICGVVHADDVDIITDAGADLVGLNFVPESSRCLDLVTAEAIAQRADGVIERVALFRNPSCEEIERVTRRIDVERIQFHGEESEEQIEMVDLPVIKAIRGGDLVAAEQYPDTLILLDHPTESGGGGSSWDWGSARELIIRGFDIILAGGLTPDNIEKALGALEDSLPWGVDVATGVEANGNRKDSEKVRNLVQKVRHFEAQA